MQQFRSPSTTISHLLLMIMMILLSQQSRTDAIASFSLSESSSLSATSSTLLRGTTTTTTATSSTDKWRNGDNSANNRIERRRTEDAVTVPQLGSWSRMIDFPVDTGESQGALVGCDLISVGGFYPNFSTGPTITYTLDLCDPDAQWKSMAQLPILPFLTHGAHAHKGDNLMYLCGGYLGKHAGESIDDCMVFDKTDGPTGSWTSIPSLPKKRGGGGMIYIKEEDKLMFSLGALRPDKNTDGIDKNNTWFLDLSGDEDAKWSTRKGGSPYLGNHVTSVVAKDCAGNTRYYFLGGQVGEQEKFNNIDLVYEYIPETDTFIQRTSMDQPRGHFTVSVAPYGCGFIIVGGAINGDPTKNTWSDDVIYYDIDSDTWHTIGKYPELIKTPVCGIVSDVLYCANGYTVNSYKVDLSFSSPSPPVPTTPAPITPAPVPSPVTDDAGDSVIEHLAVISFDWQWIAGVMPENLVIDTTKYGKKLRIQAVLGGREVDSVVFDLSPYSGGNKFPKTDSEPSYFLVHTFDTNIEYTLTVTPYLLSGETGISYSRTFTLV